MNRTLKKSSRLVKIATAMLAFFPAFASEPAQAQYPCCPQPYSPPQQPSTRFLYEYPNGVWVNQKGYSVNPKTPGARHLPHVRGVYTSSPKPDDKLKRIERELGLNGTTLIYIFESPKINPNHKNLKNKIHLNHT